MRKRATSMMPEATVNETRIPPRVAGFLVGLEKWVFPLVYTGLAWRQFQGLRAQSVVFAALGTNPSLSALVRGGGTADFLRGILVMALMLFTAGALWLNRAPTVLPDRLKHVLVPFAMCSYFVLYGLVDVLPPDLGSNILPTAWQLPLALGGVGISLVGYGISLWAIAYLGRAFALFVAVRKVVLGGPYAHVRHPIYAGYLLDSLGLLLVTGSVAMLALVAGFVGLMVCRAKLEEEKLAEGNADYAAYRRRTGFLWPHLGRSS